MNHKNATQHRLALSAILFLLVAGATAVQAAIPASERAVLLDLYASTNGGSWTESSGWGGAVGTECTWYGVTCDAGGNTVKFIVLQQDNLSGSLPGLTGLTNLQYFLVDSNQLTGSIPTLTGLTNLQFFRVDSNQLTGSIPALTGLVNLQGFRADLNQLTGPIPALGGLTNLAVFSACCNQLTGSIPALSGLTNLGEFDVGGNQLTGAIPALTGLTNLRDFLANSNQLTGPIPALAGLTSLRSFEVQENQLTGAIPVVDGLTSLQYFYANQNQLTGPIPALTGLTNLQDFIVSLNQLSGSIPALTGLTSLQTFYVFHNQLSGSIPSLTGLTSLVSFLVDHNQLTGSIPALTGLTNLQSFAVDSNQLTGSIPALTGLTDLQYFDVDSNQLTGSIPALAGLTNLFSFAASDNQLTDGIPALNDLINLQSFFVDSNQLQGSIPALTGLTHLLWFNVANNQLTGPLPSLTGLTSLDIFDVNNNQLSGSIPALTGLTNLQVFRVHSNRLTSTIPTLAGLTRLQAFRVENNQLTGDVPSVPLPNGLFAAQSQLCPNFLNHTPDPAWDVATGLTPWYAACDPLPSVTTRMVVANGAASSTKIVPGGSVSMDVRLGVVTARLVGTRFMITQTSPVTSDFFSITGRSFSGSPFNDPGSGAADSIVLSPPSNLLDPTNDDNLGRRTIGLVGIPPANDILAVNLTLSASATTPLGTYTIAPTPTVSFATDDAFVDYDMSTAAPLSIIVGQTLTVTRSGTGAGTVAANTGAINCGPICSDIYPGTGVTLTATPALGSVFVRWENACTGSGACVVTVDATKTVNAVFDAQSFALTVTKSGSGSGTVTSAPAGIDCGASCTALFTVGTPVGLTPVPAAGSVFARWESACAGGGACALTMDAAKTVNTVFDLAPVQSPPVLAGAASRRVHGTAGTFNLPLSLLATNPTTEPRQGPAHTIVFTFDKAVTAGVATVTEGTATAGMPTFSGSEMIVPLTGVANQQYVTVAVSGVASADGGTGGSGSVRLGFLLGDVNQNRVVTLSDLGQVNAQIAQFVTGANYLKDVNASGTLSLADKGITNTQLTRALPAP